MDKVRLAYFGTGRFAQKQHLAELNKWKNVVVEYAVSPSQTDREQFARMHQEWKGSRPQLFASLEEFLSPNPDFDGAVIATPVDSHFALACALLDLGKPLYVEKPFMSTRAEAQEIADKADRLHVPVVIGANRCVFPAYRTAANALRSGVIGNVGGLLFCYEHSWDTLTKDCSWRQDPNHPGSGLLRDHFAHYGHYLVNLRFHPKRAEHITSTYNENGVDVSTTFHLYDSNNKAAVFTMNGLSTDKGRKEEITIYGTKGVITVTFEGKASEAYLELNARSKNKMDNSCALAELQALGISNYTSHPALLHNYLHIVQGKSVSNASPARDGVLVARMTDAVLSSRIQGKITTLV